ncbi:MAG: hypothetical protein ACYCY6_00060 [Minisyncoccota bacterium]
MERIVVTNDGGCLGSLWVIGWLFTIGYLKLSFWKGVLAIIVWPYYLGKHYTKINSSN